MNYKIASRPTIYKGHKFRSRLEARWAAFFDLIGYKWAYEPIDFTDWIPDFRVEFSCGHSECCPTCTHASCIEKDKRIRPTLAAACPTYCFSCYEKWGNHAFYAEVKPYESITQFKGHPVMLNDYGERYGLDGGLALGIDPSVAQAEFSHGSGGGVFSGHDLFTWELVEEEEEIPLLWAEAGNITRWEPNKSNK